MGRLESAGIPCLLPDELMSVISTFGLTVMGGIRLQVCVKDEKDAQAILTDAGI